MFRFPKERRLCGRDAVGRVFAQGRGGFVHPLRYTVVEGEGLKVLVSVPKKLHKRAVRRNLLKRRMREAFRLKCSALPTGTHIALIYAVKDVEDYHVIESAVERICEIICGAD